MAYNSDYDVRLATLGALGGDTAKTYDSVYEIDLAILDAIEHGGGGGGMDYNQMKELLASSGVTEILFIGNGSGETVTLDYDLISQIGQGGGDYICVNGIDALSGITDPKDGMMAYVDAITKQEERMIVELDFYNTDGGWNRLNFTFSGSEWEPYLSVWENGNGTSFEGNARYEDGSDTMNAKQYLLPQNFTFNNGAKGTYFSFEEGEEYATHNEYKNTFWFEKFNGEYPTVTFAPNEDCVLVSSSITTDMVSITYPQIGVYKYYADVQKWLPFEVNWDTMDGDQKQDVLNKGAQYRKPLSCFRTNDDGYGLSVRKYDAFYNGYYDYYENPRVNQIAFMTKTYRNPSTDMGFIQFACNRDDGSQKWNIGNTDTITVPSRDYVDGSITNKLSTTSASYPDLQYGGLRSVGITGTFSGVTVSTTIAVNTGMTNYEGITEWNNRRSGRYFGHNVNEQGYIKVCGMSVSASTNAEWFVFDYNVDWMDDQQRHNAEVAAVKVEDNGDDTFTITYFMTNDNWNGDNWDNEHYGETDDYTFRYNNDRGYTWTVTEHQTITVTPHLYQAVYDPTLPMDDYRVKLLHKLL